MFSKLKRVTINFRCYFGVKRFENILRNMEEGSSWETFDLMTGKVKVRRTTEEKGSRSYKSRNSAEVNVKCLSDNNIYDEVGNTSENGDKGYLFSSDSE